MAFNDAYLVQRLSVAPCVDKRIAGLDATLAEATRTGLIGSLPKGDFALTGPLDNNQWQSERASQSLTHFPRRELTWMSRYYSVIETYKTGWLAEEGQHWDHLSGLQTGPRAIAPQELADMRYHLAAARWLERIIVYTARAELKNSAALGIKPELRPTATMPTRVCGGVTPAVVMN